MDFEFNTITGRSPKHLCFEEHDLSGKLPLFPCRYLLYILVYNEFWLERHAYVVDMFTQRIEDKITINLNIEVKRNFYSSFCTHFLFFQ